MTNRSKFKPKKLIQKLKADPEIRRLYERSAGLWEGLTIEEHSLRVMAQFERYFAGSKLPCNMDRGLFRLALALHDIGKPLAMDEGQKHKQHGYTKSILRRILIKWTDKDCRDLVIALIDGDPIGMYLKGTLPLKKAAAKIRSMAKEARQPMKSFFKLLTIYYQTDVSAYTTDAGSYAALDHLFEYDANQQRICKNHKTNCLRFSLNVQNKFDVLRNCIHI